MFVATDDKNVSAKLPSDNVLPAVGNMLFTKAPAVKVALSRWGAFSRQDSSAYIYAQSSGGDVAFGMVTEAIADIYLLSQASVFIGSISSTFGTVASQCGLQSRGPGGAAKKVYYIDGADVASGHYKCSVTSYMLLSEHDFATVSKILGDDTGKAVRFNIEAGLPEYSPATVDRLFPPTPYVRKNMELDEMK